jgi:hypothetical protein
VQHALAIAPTLSERRHRSLARRLVSVSCALSSEIKVPEVCDLENHKCDNGDDQECRQCNQFMPCIKHPIPSNSSAWPGSTLAPPAFASAHNVGIVGSESGTAGGLESLIAPKTVRTNSACRCVPVLRKADLR